MQLVLMCSVANIFYLFSSIEMNGNEHILKEGSGTVLHIDSLGHTLYAFINGKLIGNVKQVSQTGSVRDIFSPF